LVDVLVFVVEAFEAFFAGALAFVAAVRFVAVRFFGALLLRGFEAAALRGALAMLISFQSAAVVTAWRGARSFRSARAKAASPPASAEGGVWW
jgi:hypothetical protein